MPVIIAAIRASPPTTPPIIGPKLECLVGGLGGGVGDGVGSCFERLMKLEVEEKNVDGEVVLDITAPPTGV